MIWAELTNLGKKIFQLSGRVNKNAEQITELSRKLDALTTFVNKVTRVVSEQKRDLESLKERTEKDIAYHQKISESEREKLVLRLQLEISELENRLNAKGLSFPDKPQDQITPGDN